jgi:RsiW-degrading membrane proteinase PrsW (M82 family)
MITIYLLIGVLSSWIWVDYFRLINVLDKDKPNSTYLTFLLGAGAYFLYNLISEYLLVDFEINIGDKIVEHLFVSVFKIGLIGEFIKLIPIMIVYLLFKNHIKRPIDVFVYFTISALGFSALENIFYSFQNEFYVFNEIVILRTISEMFCSSFIAFGIIDFRFHSKHKKPLRIFMLVILAAFLHGFYDFCQYYENLNNYGFILTIIYFLIMTSIFANTLTSSLNLSEDFVYGKQLGSKIIINKLLKYFVILTVFQFMLLFWKKNFSYAIDNLINTIWFSALVVYIAVNRLNKIKIIKKRWNKIKIELPFTFYRIDTFNGRTPAYKFKFKGETFNEEYIDIYYNEICTIYPLSSRNSYIVSNKLIFIEKKFFLKNDETFYLVKIVNTDDKNEFMLLKPKTSGKNMVKKKYPIVALFSIHDLEDIKNNKLTAADFQYREWVFIKHR